MNGSCVSDVDVAGEEVAPVAIVAAVERRVNGLVALLDGCRPRADPVLQANAEKRAARQALPRPI